MRETAADASYGGAAIPFSFLGRARLGGARRGAVRRGAAGTPAGDFLAVAAHLAAEARPGDGDANFIG